MTHDWELAKVVGTSEVDRFAAGLSEAAKEANAAALAAEMLRDADSFDSPGQEVGHLKKKKRYTVGSKAPKEYNPQPGSANYAFLIVLLKVTV